MPLSIPMPIPFPRVLDATPSSPRRPSSTKVWASSFCPMTLSELRRSRTRLCFPFLKAPMRRLISHTGTAPSSNARLEYQASRARPMLPDFEENRMIVR